MTGSSPMRCDDARELLMELACGDLDPALGSEVRAHASGCPKCGPELQGFERVMGVARQLPVASPSADFDARILKAARASLNGRPGLASARESLPEATGYRAWFARLADWAMSPQVAMASVLLLVVGIGLYTLPLGRQTESLAFDTEHDATPARAPAPAASAAAAPSAAAEPEAPAERAQNETRAAAPAEVSKRSAKKDESAKAMQKTRARSAELDYAPRKAAKASSKSSGADADPLRGLGGLGGGSAADDALAREELREKKAEQAPAGAYAPPPPAASNAPARPSAPAAAAPAAEGPSMGGSAETKGGASQPQDWASRLSQGVSSAKAGDYDGAIRALEPVANKGTGAERITATRWLAKSLRASGNCAAALRYYAVLTRPAKVDPEVLDEAADCYQRTGDAARADALRQRAR